MVLDNVPRISAPAPDVLLRDWVRPAVPVIFTDLFDSAPLRPVDTLAQARAVLADIPLEVQPNYLTFLETGRRGEPRPMKLGAYLDHAAQHPSTRELCVEFPTPAPLAALLPPPACAELADLTDSVSATFLANAGNYNHLHFDDDQRHVLLYQAFGNKRFSLISPDHGRKLDAFLLFDPKLRSALAALPARDANGRVYLQTVPSEAERDAFLRYAGASDCILRPGETLFMPALYWHYVEYCDTALSVTYRLGRNRLNRALSALFPQPTVILQAVAARLTDEPRFAHEHPALHADLTQLLDSHAPPEHVQPLLDRAFAALTGDSAHSVRAARELYRRSLAE